MLTSQKMVDVYSALVEDVCALADLPLSALEPSLTMVKVSIHSRGLSVLLRDLPSICSDLEYSLEIGWYKRRYQGPLSSMKGFLPVLFRPLYRRVFCIQGVLLEAPCTESIRLLRQLLRCFKKFKIDCPASTIEEKINDFLRIETELPTPLYSWGDRDFLCDRGWPSLSDMVLRGLRSTGYRELLRSAVPGFDFGPDTEDGKQLLRCASWAQSTADSLAGGFKHDNASKPRHGPGAVSERYELSKFEFPSWNYRLEKVYPFDLYGMVNHSLYDVYGDEPEGFRNDPPSKLIAVPKDFNGPRLIASEPISSQFIQQLILQQLRRGVKDSFLRHSIDFKSQLPSRDLALAASIDRKYSTIDLSSASDRLSCAVVECVFRANHSFLERLNAARTPRLHVPEFRGLQIKPTELALKKFAAQGAAFTFPVQSIAYAILAIGCVREDNPRLRISDAARRVRVYGDDIAVPTHLDPYVKALLICLGLEVNSSKSFYQGSFRESCGMDAFNGVDVTPAYIRDIPNVRTQPSTVLSVVECSNNLYLRGFIRASSTLLESLPPGVLKRIPWVLVGSDSFGIVGPHKWSNRTRYNRKLQRFEFQSLTIVLSDRGTKESGAARLHHWFVEEPSADRVFDPRRINRRKLKFSVSWSDISLLGR